MIGQLGGVAGYALNEAAQIKRQEEATKRGILAAEREKEKQSRRRNRQQKYTTQETTPPTESQMSSSLHLLSDFGYIPLDRFAGTAKADKVIRSLGKADRKFLKKAAELEQSGQNHINRMINMDRGVSKSMRSSHLRPAKNPNVNTMDYFTQTKFDNISPADLNTNKTRQILPYTPQPTKDIEERSPVFLSRYIRNHGENEKRQAAGYRTKADKVNFLGRDLSVKDLQAGLAKKPSSAESMNKLSEKFKARKSGFDRATYNHYGVADFGVPLWQRWGIEASEGLKTLGGVAKDLATKKAWTDPVKNKMWTEDLGRGFTEARNRVKQNLSKTNKANIEREIAMNKKAVQEELERKKQAMANKVQQMRSQAEQTYKDKGIKGLAPSPRVEYDGVLALDKRYKVGKRAM